MKADVWNVLFLVTHMLHLLTDTEVLDVNLQPCAEMVGTCSHYETRAGHQQHLAALCITVILLLCVSVCVCVCVHTVF